MHEFAITQQIFETANEYAKKHEAKSVTAINLVVGDLCGCVADSVALYFDLMAADSLCENAKLNIERVKPQLKCKVCGELFERRPFSFDCPKIGCGGEGEPTEIGREFEIRSIEIV